eukprot:c15462_g1_i3.p1 GENE.c15462_g1_i3~~c15462_g1_i3.p1  ORF type:complete len:255 (+),score=47.54 c15462_g1_i3:40-804(+)
MDVAVADLLQEHQNNISAVRQLTGLNHTQMDDLWIVRYLVSSNVDKAATRIQEMWEWRQKYSIHEIARDIEAGMEPWQFPYHDLITAAMPQTLYFDHTRSGSPFSIEECGRWDIQRVVAKISPAQLATYNQYKFEYIRIQLARMSAATGLFKRWLVIFDANGCSMAQYSLDFLKMTKPLSGMLQRHYRECISKVFLVNCNSTFKFLWSIVRPLLRQRSVAKCCILGEDYQDLLAENVEPYRLPPTLGGRILIVD